MRSKLPVLLTVCAAVLAINLDTTIVNVALPSISTDLDAGTRALQWIVDGYNLAFAALVLAAGSLSDRYGRRPALILGPAGLRPGAVRGRGRRLGGRADRRPGGDGHRGGGDLPDHAVDHQQHLPRAPRARCARSASGARSSASGWPPAR